MKVYVVVLEKDHGVIVGVFSTLEKASNYIGVNPYNTYVIHERTVDKVE